MHFTETQVSEIESRTDMYVSTVRRQVEAMGGKLELIVSFPGEHPFVLSGVGDLTARVKRHPGAFALKVSEKGAVSLYGLGRFPVTLYKEQWIRILAGAAEIEAFIRENDARLKTKE